MKVLIIHPQMNYYGGAELLIAKFSNYLTEKGIENKILTLNKSENAVKEIKAEVIAPDNNVKISSSGFDSIKELIKGILILRKEAKKIYKNFDVINYHNFPATWALFPRKKPSVWMLNEPPNLWSKPNAGKILRLANFLRNKIDRMIVNRISIICVSDEFNKKRALERYGKEARIVNYGIDYGFFSSGNKNKARKKYKLKNKFVIMQSGVLSEQKNQLESIKAMEKIRKKIPNILLILAGKAEKEYGEKLRLYIKEKNLEKNVLFTGNLVRGELRDLYAAADIGIFPIKSQGGWLAPFEMLCTSKTILISREFTAASLIEKNNLGVVTDEYPKEIIKIFKNKGKYQKEAKRAASFVKKNLSWEAFGEKMIETFEDAENHNL